jgi:Tfp pilus assembly protein PilX
MDVKTFRLMTSKMQLANNERGMALVTALLLLTVLAILITVSTQWAASDVHRTAQYTKSRTAFYIAEAGIQTALHELNYTSGVAPGAASNGFGDELDGTTTNWGPYSNVSYGGGTFTVTMEDNVPGSSTDSDETVILSSTGVRNGVSVTIEALIHRGTYEADHAIITEGDLTASGNISVLGTAGSIHSNEDLNINGSTATITEGATGVVTCTGVGCIASGVDHEEIPTVNLSVYKPYANYILKSNGTIYDQTTLITYTYTNPGGGNWTGDDVSATNGNNEFKDISHSTPGGDVLWTFNGNSKMDDGMYYVEGNAKVQNTPNGWKTTIVADGYIDFSAGGVYENYDGTGPLTNTPDIQSLLFIAGTDIEFSGNPSQAITGLIYAKEQLSVSGTVALNGYAIAANVADVENLVSPDSTISGSMSITYNADIPTSLLSEKVVILTWQET